MTVGGLLRIDESDGQDVIHLGKAVVPLDGVRAHPLLQLPKKGKAEFVIYSVWSGCANCGVDYFILDAGAQSPEPLYITHSEYGSEDGAELEDGGDLKILSYKPGAIVIRRFASETTLLGDLITDVLQYHRGDKDFTVIRHSAVYDYRKFVGSDTTDLLSDTEARYSLVELMGMKAFGEFRDCLRGDDQGMKLVDDRYLVGVGLGYHCQSDNHTSMVVIDTYFDRAWALQRDHHFTKPKQATYKAWGNLGKDDNPVRELLEGWIGDGKTLASHDGPIEIIDSPATTPSGVSPPR